MDIPVLTSACTKPNTDPARDLTTNLTGTYIASGARIGGTYLILPQSDASARLIVDRSGNDSVIITFELVYMGNTTQSKVFYYLIEGQQSSGQQGLVLLTRQKDGPQVGKFSGNTTVDLNYSESGQDYTWIARKQ